jgi:hypothetical protein
MIVTRHVLMLIAFAAPEHDQAVLRGLVGQNQMYVAVCCPLSAALLLCCSPLLLACHILCVSRTDLPSSFWGIAPSKVPSTMLYYCILFSQFVFFCTDLENDLDDLVGEANEKHVELHNCFNALLMLSSNQFIENVHSFFLPMFLDYIFFIFLAFFLLLVLNYSTYASHKLNINTLPQRVYEDDVEELLGTESTSQGPPAPDEVLRYVVCYLFTVCISNNPMIVYWGSM